MSTLVSVAVVLPIAAIELGIWIWALVDLARTDRVRGGSKLVWAVVIVFFQLVGSILYLAWGRNPEPPAEPGRENPGDPRGRGW